jgi:membrane-associated phospholipid phosphatase
MAQQQTNTRLSRRMALRAGAAGAVVATFAHAPLGAWAASPNASTDQLEPDAGSWTTWVLESGRELRPSSADVGATRSEIEALKVFAANREPAVLEQIDYWDTGSPGYRWNQIAIAQGLKDGIAIAAYRVLALVNMAIYDATVAAWDAKYAYNRPRPSEADRTLTTVIPSPSSPAYPCEHSAAAGAAAAVLAYLFPKDAQSFIDKANSAGAVAPLGRGAVPERRYGRPGAWSCGGCATNRARQCRRFRRAMERERPSRCRHVVWRAAATGHGFLEDLGSVVQQ